MGTSDKRNGLGFLDARSPSTDRSGSKTHSERAVESSWGRQRLNLSQVGHDRSCKVDAEVRSVGYAIGNS